MSNTIFSFEKFFSLGVFTQNVAQSCKNWAFREIYFTNFTELLISDIRENSLHEKKSDNSELGQKLPNSLARLS